VEASRRLHRNVYEELIMYFKLLNLKPILFFRNVGSNHLAELHPRRTESSIEPLWTTQSSKSIYFDGKKTLLEHSMERLAVCFIWDTF